nr:uncharacterized protein LOC109178280 [Ipomoea trifida]
MQQFLEDTDTTVLSYWLNWRVFMCSLLLVLSVFIAFVLLWKYEYSADEDDDSASDSKAECWHLWFNEAWRPCAKEVNPIWLMAFRLVSFSLLVSAVTSNFVVYGSNLFFYYTQWTFNLVTIYFGFGSLLSIYGCYQYSKESDDFIDHSWMDEKQGLDTPLIAGTAFSDGIKKLDYPNRRFVPKSAGLCGYLFQVLFQMTAGAVMLTDLVYWFLIFPALDDHGVSFMTVVSHTLNTLFLGDAALNSLPLPWFRIAYFIFWTVAYVIFQWVVHACESIWWPYPILDLSSAYAPLWYLLVAMMHIPCYGFVAMLIGVKRIVLSRWFPSHVAFSDKIQSSCHSPC